MYFCRIVLRATIVERNSDYFKSSFPVLVLKNKLDKEKCEDMFYYSFPVDVMQTFFETDETKMKIGI